MLLIYNMEEEQTFKTPNYQRKAYKDYYARKKEDPEWIEDQKQKRKVYYEKNKEKILERLKNKRINSKEIKE
jgi:hypothetical protein